jgi:hypothetical protein
LVSRETFIGYAMPDLSDGANWSQTDANNNNPSPNGWPEGMMPSGVNDAARADRGALKRFWDKINPVQTITASGGVYTFTTANPAYPTAYVSGEIYRFRPNGASVGGEMFQVNTLGPKPLWKRIAAGSAGLVPIVAQDIFGARAAEVVYDSVINAGAGAFVLTNPFTPLTGDGAGGVSLTGSLSADGYQSHSGLGGAYQSNRFNIQWTGSGAHLWIDNIDEGRIVTSTTGNVSLGGGLTVVAGVTADGYQSHSGQGGAYQSNFFNVQWTGSGAHLWIDTTDQGRIVTSTAGNVTLGGSLTAIGVNTSGGMTVTAGGVDIQSGGLSVTGGGNISTSGDVSAHSLNASGGITVTAGGVNIQSGGLSVTNDISGHTLSASGGLVATAGGLNVTGNSLITGNLSVTGTLSGNVANLSGGLSAGGALTITGQSNLNHGLYVTGAYPSDAGGHTIYCNGGLAAQGVIDLFSPGGSTWLSTALTVPHIYVLPGQADALIIASGNLTAAANVNITGNLTVGGTLNGHPAMAIFDQLEALASRVQALEAALTERT